MGPKGLDRKSVRGAGYNAGSKLTWYLWALPGQGWTGHLVLGAGHGA